MRTASTKPTLGAVLRGMLHMRLCELRTRGSLLRLAGTFVLLFALLSYAFGKQEPEAFWGLAAGVFLLKFLPVYCLTKGGETLRSELKDGTIEYLWTRPAAKTQLYLGFYLSALLGSAAIAVSCLLAISLAGLYLGAITGVTQLLLLWLGAACAVVVFTAVASALGALSSKFVVIGIFYFAFVELGLGEIPTSIRNIAATAHLKAALAPLLDGSPVGLASPLLGLAVIGAVALAAGGAIFRTSRYSIGGDKEG